LLIVTFVYYFVASLLLDLSLHHNGWDLGIFLQILYNNVHGNFFQYSFRSYNYLGDHFSPILVFLFPLGLLKLTWPILVVQALSLSSAVVVLYLLSRQVLKNRLLSLLLSLSFAFNPYTLQIINFDFHPDSFFPIFSFSIVHNLLKKRYILAYLFFFLLLITREDTFLLILPISVVALLKLREKKFALITFASAFSYFLLINLIVMPLIRGPFGAAVTEHYSYLGGSIEQIIINSLKNPFLVVSELGDHNFLGTLLKFFGSNGFIALLNPLILISALPIFLSHLLSNVPMRFTLSGHYPAQPLVPLYLAAIFSLAFVNGKMAAYPRGKIFLGIYLAVFTILSFSSFSPFPPSLAADSSRFTPNNHTRLFFKIKNLIPEEAVVSTQSNLLPFFAFRRRIYQFPRIDDATYVFLDQKGAISEQSLEAGYGERLEHLGSLGFKLIKDEDGFRVYRRL
jgi:uncharacterized membrane protein